jgi:hypothetical protein
VLKLNSVYNVGKRRVHLIRFEDRSVPYFLGVLERNIFTIGSQLVKPLYLYIIWLPKISLQVTMFSSNCADPDGKIPHTSAVLPPPHPIGAAGFPTTTPSWCPPPYGAPLAWPGLSLTSGILFKFRKASRSGKLRFHRNGDGDLVPKILLAASLLATQRAGIEGGMCRADGEGNGRLGGGRWTPD